MTYLESINAQREVLTSAQEIEKKPVDTNASQEHNFVLSQREAEAASPDFAVCGEEDPGEGLEFLVVDDQDTEEKKSST